MDRPGIVIAGAALFGGGSAGSGGGGGGGGGGSTFDYELELLDYVSRFHWFKHPLFKRNGLLAKLL